MSETGQVVASAAEVYDRFFVPALFEQWPTRVADAAGIAPGNRVLDVACGTGVLARSVADRVGPTGSVIGLDVNENMLSVARTKAPEIDWRTGNAEELPFNSKEFDVVVCQFALMFFRDRVAALREMARVLKPNGRLALAVWGPLNDSPGYAEMTELLRRLFGNEAAAALEAPFELGNKSVLDHLFTEAGLTGAQTDTQVGTARFPSIHEWVRTEIKGWTLAAVLDEEQYQLLQREAERDLRGFVNDGRVSFPISAHTVVWKKAG